MIHVHVQSTARGQINSKNYEDCTGTWNVTKWRRYEWEVEHEHCAHRIVTGTGTEIEIHSIDKIFCICLCSKFSCLWFSSCSYSDFVISVTVLWICICIVRHNQPADWNILHIFHFRLNRSRKFYLPTQVIIVCIAFRQ